MSKRLLYLEDLYDFYSKYKKSTHFSANGKEPLVVQVAGKVNFDSNTNSTEGLTKVHLQSCHTDLNVNQSFIEQSVMENALDSFKNRPILGYIHSVNGQDEFYTHNMHEENGEIIYDEVPVGIIPESCNAQIIYDEEKGKSYVEVDGYLFNEYSKASEILQREQECFVSVELSIRELSYQAKEKYLNIEDFFFSGVTILGKTPNGEIVQPGMSGSNIKLADFSESNNSLFANKIDSLTEKVDILISRFNDINFDNSKEGGKDSQMNKLDELLSKYNKTTDDLDFDYESMSDDELEAKFAELFGEEDTAADDWVDDTTDDNADNSDDDTTDDTDGDNSTDDNPSDDSNTTYETTYSKEELFNQLFDISFNEIHYALNALCSIYRNDNEWCYVSQVYDDYFIMEDWDNNKYYKQSYEKDGDNVALTGERIEMFAMMVTESEKITLEDMRSNYASLVEFKETVEKNELHAKREEILANEKYTSISEKDKDGKFINEAFAKLYSEMDNYSIEELDREAKIIFADSCDISNYSLNKPTTKHVNFASKLVDETPKKDSFIEGLLNL